MASVAAPLLDGIDVAVSLMGVAVATLPDVVPDPSDPQEQAIISRTSTKDAIVSNIFLLGFMLSSFGKMVNQYHLLYNIIWDFQNARGTFVPRQQFKSALFLPLQILQNRRGRAGVTLPKIWYP